MFTAYTTSGDSGLAARKRGPQGGGGNLKGWQAAAICNLIRDHHPEQLKLPFVLWTSGAIQRLIARRFGVKLSARSVRGAIFRVGGLPRKSRFGGLMNGVLWLSPDGSIKSTRSSGLVPK